MAAGQRKKKLNGASVIKLSSYEHNAAQKKLKQESSDIILNMTSHVSLEWDDSQNKVVAKRGQIGITWKDMAPFLDSVPEFRTGLADVLSIPPEIFGLENIADVLSYEVWKTFLSEQERKLLVQFLPKGVNVDDVVPPLLAGENFHFGNSFCTWGASLCAGDLHPDALSHMEQQLRAIRNSYFCELRKYHLGTLDNLSKLKERWTSCRSTEKEIAAKIWREGSTKLTNRRPSVAPGKTKILCVSEEQLHDTCFQDGDTAKYMSYIKINKKQHQLVKNILNFGDGIHSKCLSDVLGDINSFNIQPYEAFEEEERKRLHECWLQLVNTDLPAAFEYRRQCRLSREKWRKCVQQELEEKKRMTKDERKNPMCSPAEKVDGRDSEQEWPHDMQDAGKFQPIHFNDHHHLERNCTLDAHQGGPTISDQDQNLFIFKAPTADSNYSMDNHDVEKIPSLNSPHEHSPSEIDLGRNEYIVNQATISPGPSQLNKYEDAAEDVMESKPPCRIACHLERIPSLNSHNMDIHEHGDQHLINCSYNSPVTPQFLQSVTTDILEEKLPMSSPKDRWQSGSTGHSYHHYSPDCRISRSVGELAVQQPQPVGGRSSQLIDLEVQTLDPEAADSVSSPLHDGNRETMFSSNANQDPGLLLPSFHMQGMSSPCPEEDMNGSKHSGLQFLVSNDGLRQPSQFPHLFHEQQFLKQSQAREKDLYMLPTLNRNMQSSSRYPSQGHFLSVGLQDLANFQSPVCGGLMGHNWFTAEHNTRNGWPGAETFGATSQQVEDAGNADESLFSVLSECSKLASHSSLVTTSSEAFLPGRNFVGTSNPRSEGAYMYVLGDANSRDAAALKMNSMPWMDFSLQNRGL